MDVHFDGKRFPVEAVSYLAKRELGSPVLAPDYWGGYVIYRLHPNTLVAMDDRHDLYGQEYLKSYLKTMHVEPGWEDFLQEHGIQCVLVTRGSALANILAETKGWKPIYADDLAITFARVSGG